MKMYRVVPQTKRGNRGTLLYQQKVHVH